MKGTEIMIKRILSLLLALLLLCGFSAAEEEFPFAIHHGSRESPKIAITVDDGFDLPCLWKIRDLFKEYGITGTFFPVGYVLFESDRENWQKVLDYGNEIGSHNYPHAGLGNCAGRDIVRNLGRFQERLDATLGYHYEVRSFRPPFGRIRSDNGDIMNAVNSVKKYGYEHIILWDVSQTRADVAIHQVQNGSVLLYHARPADYECLKTLIPALLEKGFQPVTVSELLGYGPNETSETPYIYDPADFFTD